jgi:hypothetical protein
MPKYNAADLDQFYLDADNVDQEIFAEMRSNILLVSGDHYQKQGSKFWNRLRTSEDIDKQQRLRLTKNHIKNITSEYVSVVTSHSPSATIVPNNQDELQDQKSAELNKAVLEYYKKNMNLRSKTRDKCEDFFIFGEVWSRTFFDPDQGEVKTYEQATDEDGFPLYDDNAEPILDESKPIMTGAPVVERIFPFNILRAPEAQSFDESPYICVRRMMKKSELRRMLSKDDFSKATNGTEETYIVFRGDSGLYERSKNEVMIREFYFRPTKEYPKGYFYICTRSFIMYEGELPFGIWLLTYAICDKIPTSCRGRSIIKQMRPYQVEINRAASAIATAQITLGDDKIILSHGSRMAHGGQVPGVRGISVTGSSNYQILPGRSGEQYVPYMEKQIAELYSVMGMKDIDISEGEGILDPYAMLFRSIKNKRRFSKYTEAFEEFTVNEMTLLLNICKQYLEPDVLIPMIGKSEIVNIAEFKNSDPNAYRIRVEPVSTDAETLLGKQISITQALQYVGGNLEKEDIGKLLRSMPFLNQEEIFDEFNISYDNAKNDILALERGEIPVVNPYDDHPYIIKRLVHRMRKADFKFLPQEVQYNFKVLTRAHEMADAEQKAAILRAQQGLIPTGGYLVTCDFYITLDNGKTQRVRLPYEAIRWLIEQLKVQGNTVDELEKMSQGTMAEMAGLINSNLASPVNTEKEAASEDEKSRMLNAGPLTNPTSPSSQLGQITSQAREG